MANFNSSISTQTINFEEVFSSLVKSAGNRRRQYGWPIRDCCELAAKDLISTCGEEAEFFLPLLETIIMEEAGLVPAPSNYSYPITVKAVEVD